MTHGAPNIDILGRYGEKTNKEEVHTTYRKMMQNVVQIYLYGYQSEIRAVAYLDANIYLHFQTKLRYIK